MEEAFLLQMNDFDRLLEVRLRQMLDPVVATRPPTPRGRSKRTREPRLAVAVAAPFPAAVFGRAVAPELIPVAAEQPAVL